MYCSKCGKEIKDDEKYCGSCGEITANNNYNLIISRPNKVMGCAVQLHVTIGDTEYELGAGREYKITLPKGSHVIKYKIWCRREHEVTVTIEDGKVCNVIFAYDALWGGFKISKKSVL